MFDVLTIGSATRDVFMQSPAFRAIRARKLEHLGFPTGQAECFPLGGKIEIETPIFTVGGGAANAAVTFARQGLKTACLCTIGDDESGKSVVTDLKKEKITPLALTHKKAMTSYSVILLAPSGERTILNHRGASEDMKKDEFPVSRMNAKVGYIVPGRIPLPVIMAAVKVLKDRHALLAMDPSKFYLEMGVKKLKPLLNALDVVKMNREEASYLTGMHYDDEAGIFRKLDELVGGLVVMTDGPRGIIASDGKRIYRAGTYKEKIVKDRTGAGDAFGSGLMASLASSKSWKKEKKFTPEEIIEAIKLGSANATSVVEHIGAQPGIITKSQFRSARWKNLPVEVKEV